MTPNSERLIQIIDHWQTRMVLVVGDFMVDRYVYGNADRLSPDAPVPVLAAQRQEYKPGGAANVCMNLRAIGCEVVCLGVLGNDTAADKLKETLATAGCDVQGLIPCPGRPTTVKHNFVGLAQHRHPQKMFRVDDEVKDPIPTETADELIHIADQLAGDVDVVCLEDYDKGVLTHNVCQEIIKTAKNSNTPILVDPAAIANYEKYRHATCITPNRTEASLATGVDPDTRDPNSADDAALIMARTLLDSLDLQTIVITLDKRGALLFQRDQPPQWVPTQARGVYDVTGAGDMVLTMLAGALANQVTWREAVELANAAAGLEVEKFGVVPITLDELLLSLFEAHSSDHGKVRGPSELAREIAAHRRQGKKIAFTNGCFDILHAGHVCYLRSARQQGDLLVVAVNSDQSIQRIKGPTRPVNHQQDRLMVLSELESIDYLVTFDEDTPIKLLEAIRPDVLVKGGDYTRDQVVGADLVESYGGRIELVDLVQGRSTTNIIQQLADHSTINR